MGPCAYFAETDACIGPGRKPGYLYASIFYIQHKGDNNYGFRS